MEVYITMDPIQVILIAAGIPSAVCGGLVGLLFWRLKRQIEQNAAAQKKRDDNRLKFEIYQVKMTSALAGLGKANALAIKTGKSNGETTAALAWLEEVKHDQHHFLVEHGIEHIYEKF